MQDKRLRLLWLSPNLNHYKARFLNHLAKTDDLDLTILSGTGRIGMGDEEIYNEWDFNHIKLPVTKKQFGRCKSVKNKLKELFSQFDWILIPAEKKNLPLFLKALNLKRKHPHIKLFSYNHPVLKSANGKITFFDKLITQFYYKKLDRVIFYTEDSCKWAIKEELITSEKAFWANNTIDNFEVEKYSKERNTLLNPPSILLIGRLLEYRWIDRLIKYYEALIITIPELELHVIGDGPELYKIKELSSKYKNVISYGSLVNEEDISKVMTKIDFVFVPGHSGLSINHAFAYEKPYITSKDYNNHPPEYNYLINNVNSLLLTGEEESDIEILKFNLTDTESYSKLRKGVKVSKNNLTIDNWVEQMRHNLIT